MPSHASVRLQGADLADHRCGHPCTPPGLLLHSQLMWDWPAYARGQCLFEMQMLAAYPETSGRGSQTTKMPSRKAGRMRGYTKKVELVYHHNVNRDGMQHAKPIVAKGMTAVVEKMQSPHTVPHTVSPHCSPHCSVILCDTFQTTSSAAQSR